MVSAPAHLFSRPSQNLSQSLNISVSLCDLAMLDRGQHSALRIVTVVSFQIGGLPENNVLPITARVPYTVVLIVSADCSCPPPWGGVWGERPRQLQTSPGEWRHNAVPRGGVFFFCSPSSHRCFWFSLLSFGKGTTTRLSDLHKTPGVPFYLVLRFALRGVPVCLRVGSDPSTVPPPSLRTST